MNRDKLIDLNEILQYPGRKLNHPINFDLSDDLGVELIKPVIGTFEAISTGNALLIYGQCKTSYRTECSRCTALVEKDFEFEFREEFDVIGTPASYGSGHHARVSSDEPYPLFLENALYLENFIRQIFIINLPIQNLCTDEQNKECSNAIEFSAKKETEDLSPLSQKLESLLKEKTQKPNVSGDCN